MVDNRVFVTQTGTDKLLVIDVGTQTLTDSIFVGREPNSLVVDQNGKLWVLCGSALGLATPQLVRFDLDSLSIEATFPFASNTLSPSKLRINNAGDRSVFPQWWHFPDGNHGFQPSVTSVDSSKYAYLVWPRGGSR
jgi:YVTN family beta-propeller protein